MNILYILLSIPFLFSNCSLLNSNKEKFVPEFKAEINGEKFDIAQVEDFFVQYYAGISSVNDISFISIFGRIYHEDFYPYKENISISVPWNNLSETHTIGSDTTYYNQDFYWIKRGMYSEWDGDARISNYITKPDNQGSFSVNIEELENGDRVVYGQFDFIVIMENRGDELSQHVGQDTLHITSGEYRLLLDDRRE